MYGDWGPAGFKVLSIPWLHQVKYHDARNPLKRNIQATLRLWRHSHPFGHMLKLKSYPVVPNKFCNMTGLHCFPEIMMSITYTDPYVTRFNPRTWRIFMLEQIGLPGSIKRKFPASPQTSKYVASAVKRAGMMEEYCATPRDTPHSLGRKMSSTGLLPLTHLSPPSYLVAPPSSLFHSNTGEY